MSGFRSVEGKVDLIVGLDARGFLFGPIMAAELEIPFVPVRTTSSCGSIAQLLASNY